MSLVLARQELSHKDGDEEMAIPEHALEGIENLDPLPVTVQKLISSLSGSEDVSFKELGRLIEYDPAVAANILRVANSALYAGRRRIEDPRDAVVRLGTATLLDIVLGSYLKELTVSAPLYNLSEEELWLHSAVCSIAVKQLAKEANVKIPQTTVIAALVHDVGKIIMVRYMEADVDDILDLCRQEHLTFVEAERKLFGCDHAEVGAAIGRKWAFPQPIVDAIEKHHQVPLQDPTPSLDAVILANLVSKTIGIGLGAEGLNLRADDGSYQRLGLDFRAFCRVCANTSVQVAELKQAYGIAA
ncbi:MAG TPA: HDOD domain-containing protein [Acidobacteriota bacterium]|nr:HDOD domain-containing protein [Acidobacteriota bacterium]